MRAHVSMGVGKVLETRSLMSSTLRGRFAVSIASSRRIKSSTYLKEGGFSYWVAVTANGTSAGRIAYVTAPKS